MNPRPAVIEEAKARHPSGKDPAMNATVTLTAADRCDACPAAAAYRMANTSIVAITSGIASLDWCGHHMRKNSPAMFDTGWVVIAGNPDELQGVPS